jgi:hypothetical protein
MRSRRSRCSTRQGRVRTTETWSSSGLEILTRPGTEARMTATNPDAFIDQLAINPIRTLSTDAR